MSAPLTAHEALSWDESKALYDELIRDLERATAPAEQLDVGWARLFGLPLAAYSADLILVEAEVERQHARDGGWAVQTSPYVEARIWDGSPDEEEAEFRSWAWRPPRDPPHMPRPPANTAIALMLAHLRSMGELYGQS